MIATEDDAAMALQISNTLTQALLKFRLQHATKQVQFNSFDISIIILIAWVNYVVILKVYGYMHLHVYPPLKGD